MLSIMTFRRLGSHYLLNAPRERSPNVQVGLDNVWLV